MPAEWVVYCATGPVLYCVTCLLERLQCIVSLLAVSVVLQRAVVSCRKLQQRPIALAHYWSLVIQTSTPKVQLSTLLAPDPLPKAFFSPLTLSYTT